MENSWPMDGRAILIDDPMKGVRKDAAVVTSRVTFLLTSEAFSMLLPSVANHTLHKLWHFSPLIIANLFRKGIRDETYCKAPHIRPKREMMNNK